jgi:hypothetical protein
VIGAGAFVTSGSLGADGCPADRDVLAFSLTHAENDPPYERLSDGLATVARDYGYDPLSTDDLERIEQASSNALASSTGDVFTVDPHLRDTDTVIDCVCECRAARQPGSSRKGEASVPGSFPGTTNRSGDG